MHVRPNTSLQIKALLGYVKLKGLIEWPHPIQNVLPCICPWQGLMGYITQWNWRLLQHRHTYSTPAAMLQTFLVPLEHQEWLKLINWWALSGCDSLCARVCIHYVNQKIRWFQIFLKVFMLMTKKTLQIKLKASSNWHLQSLFLLQSIEVYLYFYYCQAGRRGITTALTARRVETDI